MCVPFRLRLGYDFEFLFVFCGGKRRDTCMLLGETKKKGLALNDAAVPLSYSNLLLA